MGLAFISLLRAYAQGGSSFTGTRGHQQRSGSSDGRSAKHARKTLVAMSSSILAFLVLGITLLAAWTHAIPYAAGTPTVVVARGTGRLWRAVRHWPRHLYVVLLATILILYTGGNTSFNGFPFLANYVAGDKYLPRQLTKRGHRLAFSNGILVLTGSWRSRSSSSSTRSVNSLVSLYAIGVFTGFTLAGAGMVARHLRERSGKWKRFGVVVNGLSAFLTVTASWSHLLTVAKFKEGAWLIIAVRTAHVRRADPLEQAVRDRGRDGLEAVSGRAVRR